MGNSRSVQHSTVAPGVKPPDYISPEHRRMLFEESGIDPGVAAERGYRTITRRDELTEFSKKQRKLGLYVPTRSPGGAVSSQIRPDKPGDGPKYMSPKGSTPIADVHPRMIERVRAGTEDLYLTEGAKTADSMTSRDLPTIMLSGVWNWKVKGSHDTLIPCFDHIGLEGRTVHIVFDADCMRNPNVQDALQRLAPALESRGATVNAIYLPGPESKTGADDFFAAGHTVAEFKMLSRRYEPADIGEIRLSQDGELAAAIREAWSQWWIQDWNRVTGTGERPNWRRGHTARDVEEAAIKRATKSGVVTEEGVYFTLDIRSWSLAAAKSKPAVITAKNNLIAEGRLKRSEIEREEGRAAGYILLTARAVVDQLGGRESRGESPDSLQGPYPSSGKGPRAPRLRWSVNRQPARRGLIKGTRKPREYRFPAREGIKRLGPNRGAVVDALDDMGGSATLQELADALHKPRARDLARRATTEKGRDGLLIMLESAGIVELDGDTVSLTADWQTALHNARVTAHEADDRHSIGAETRDRNRYQRQRENFRRRHEVVESPHWTNDPEADGAIEDVKYLGPLPNQWDLYRWLDKRVQTDRGPGKLWQVLGGEARVILDSEPERWTPLDLAEVREEIAA